MSWHRWICDWNMIFADPSWSRGSFVLDQCICSTCERTFVLRVYTGTSILPINFEKLNLFYHSDAHVCTPSFRVWKKCVPVYGFFVKRLYIVCNCRRTDMGVYLTTWINRDQLKDDQPQAIACSDCGEHEWDWWHVMDRQFSWKNKEELQRPTSSDT